MRIQHAFVIIVVAGLVAGLIRTIQNYIVTSSANSILVGGTVQTVITTTASDNVWTYLVPLAAVIFVPVAIFTLFRRRGQQQ